MHQTFFAMPEQTLEKAIGNGQLRGFPCMNIKDICRYLAPSPATAKGRMKKPKAGIRSTRNSKSEIVKEEEEYAEDMHPTDGSTSSEGVIEKENNMFCFAALADKEKEQSTRMQQVRYPSCPSMANSITWSCMTMITIT